MATNYQYDYKDNASGSGREVCISDGCMSYFYHLTAGDTLEDAVRQFAENYDYNLDADADPSRVEVNLSLTEYLDGEEIDWLDRTISPKS